MENIVQENRGIYVVTRRVHKTFQLEYKNNASKPGVKKKIIEMAMNGAGTRDTGRILGISKDTVTAVLKKQQNLQNR